MDTATRITDPATQAARRMGFAAWALACALYGLFSSPTPENMTAPEYMIMALLLTASLCGGLCLARHNAPKPSWMWAWAAMLAYGATVPLALAAGTGASLPDIMRDLAAFMALALPLLLAPLFRGYGRYLFIGFMGIGLAFSGRYLASPEMVWNAIASGVGDTGFLYLANSPLVMFTASWLLLYGSFVERRVWLACACVLLAAVPLAAMLAMSQRATLAVLILAWVMGIMVCAIKKPVRALCVLGMAAVVLAVGWPLATASVQSLLHKTMALGTNARTDEWAQVLAMLSQNPITAAFGTGWGSMMPSPAVGDVWVRFVHGFVLAALWKTGWVGLVLAVIAFTALMLHAARGLLRAGGAHVVTGLSLFMACAAPVFVYGSYKSLCFGLILTGIATLPYWTTPPHNANQNAE